MRAYVNCYTQNKQLIAYGFVVEWASALGYESDDHEFAPRRRQFLYEIFKRFVVKYMTSNAFITGFYATQ